MARADHRPVEAPAAIDDHRVDRIAALGRLDRAVLADQRGDLAAVAAGQRPIGLLADEGAREGAARRGLGERGNRVIGRAFQLARRRRIAGQRDDAQLVDDDAAGAAVAVARDDELDTVGAAQDLVRGRAPGEFDFAGGDDDVLPLRRRAIIAPRLPPHIIAVGQLHLEVVAAAAAFDPEADFIIARQGQRHRAAHEGVARDAAVIVAHLDRAADRARHRGTGRGYAVRALRRPGGRAVHRVVEQRRGRRRQQSEGR
jgi:hypothetical protein